MGNLRFRKEERLNRKKIMEELFEKGSSFLVFPLKVIHKVHPDPTQTIHQILISAPSKTFKKAVERNLVKRRIREGYRLNKALLTFPKTLCVAYIYVAKEILPSTTIHHSIKASLERLNKV
ncbi:MAG: ribonuclease P protein component [Cyclobacteriaceae bacterium]|nr:ribonuclease P protein component [Cyclobacteriaceae bacterium]